MRRAAIIVAALAILGVGVSVHAFAHVWACHTRRRR